jgi:hypothetical protein
MIDAPLLGESGVDSGLEDAARALLQRRDADAGARHL